ncbi:MULTISPECIES: MBOAT family protein [unclassified Streptococcus]|uniref:MBOAT family O-acyltransferase n=2 Tax=unclassified Streptococcus TaxID=2608887 RepID=UPI001071DF88|nr:MULTISPECIES: MBOAT family O-acyltransferase [unclassified Streptococcus]TFV06570.1 MBOAT family protein [Streptococcus sp. LYSM12]
MLFTTQLFLFVFLPLSMLGYAIIRGICSINGLRTLAKALAIDKLFLIGCSLSFYMWSSFDNVFRLFFYIVIVYIIGLWIATIRAEGFYLKLYQSPTSHKKLYLSLFPLWIGIMLVTFSLVYFNYSNFLIQVWNSLFGEQLPPKSLLTPLGISFITFSSISYLTDIYRGQARPGSFLDCLLYLSFFPKVISGPTVLWKDFQGQIGQNRISLTLITEGMNRIMIGFAKKVILADTFGACLAQISIHSMDQVTAFGTLVLYMLQIYYDFAGYSDIAIGLAKLFGFEFKENFNFPYRSMSISEFWRRWHMSLGTWFKEYIYISLGGSRKGKQKTLRNLAIVFAVTGIWHGAGWNYILWGGINAFFVVAERLIHDNKYYQKIPGAIKYIVTMGIILFSWQLFRFQNIADIVTVVSAALGKRTSQPIPYTWQYYYDFKLMSLVLIGIVGATVLGSQKIKRWYCSVMSTTAGYLIQEITLLAIFIVAILFMVNSSYSPFIYFQY